MIGLIWNCQGLGKDIKIEFLKELIRKEKIDFIGIQETNKKSFDDSWLLSISSNRNFAWFWSPAKGRSGGLLVGLDADVFDIRQVDKGDFMIKVLMAHKESGFIWNFINVYGAAQNEYKQVFLTELASFCSNCKHPMLIGGDFNILRKDSDKNKPGGTNCWSSLFNSIIDVNSMIELDLSGRLYTWSNNRVPPTFEKLDRFLASPEWVLQFKNVVVTGLDRTLSDHVPLCLKTDSNVSPKRDFRYELCWKFRPDFKDFVCKSWSLPVRSRSNIDIWKEKIKRLKKSLKGWNSNVEGKYSKLKKELSQKIDLIDKKSERFGISHEERLEKLDLEWNLKNLMMEDCCKKKQMAREKFINDGDENSKYFHLIAKGKKRRIRILSLVHEENDIKNDVNINKVATDFYKDLFGPSPVSSINMSNFHMDMLNDEDRIRLTAPFTIDEIKLVVFSLKHNSAPGPDGIPAEFFQDFWEIIHNDLWNLFKDFYNGALDIKRLNFGLVTLIPKIDNPTDMRNFRPICLLNVCYKIITKVLTNRLATCITTVISPNQYGFIKGRYIMDGVVSLNEILHEVKIKKQSGVILKIDFEKAYDKVNWQFLFCMMQKKGLW
jgi:exonuclease III